MLYKSLPKSENLIKNKRLIADFIELLNDEKKYFNITLERVLNLELSFLVFKNEQLIGIAGIERKYWIPRCVIMLSKASHGKGVGSHIYGQLIEYSREKNEFLMAVVDKNNLNAIKLHEKFEFLPVGDRENLRYFIKPYRYYGYIFYVLCKIVIPFLGIMEEFRIKSKKFKTNNA